MIDGDRSWPSSEIIDILVIPTREAAAWRNLPAVILTLSKVEWGRNPVS
jgi:hypothetical protein